MIYPCSFCLAGNKLILKLTKNTASGDSGLKFKVFCPIRILSNMNLVWYGIYKFGFFVGEIDIYMVVTNEPT